MNTDTPPHPSQPRIGRVAFFPPALRWIALLALCGAYLQGGIFKLLNFGGAIAEMNHFGLAPAIPFAVATIAVEIGASLLVLTDYWRWLGALVLAGFTLFATFIANRFWEMDMPEQFMATNAFFEHLGLTGGLLLVAWYDLSTNTTGRAPWKLPRRLPP